MVTFAIGESLGSPVAVAGNVFVQPSWQPFVIRQWAGVDPQNLTRNAISYRKEVESRVGLDSPILRAAATKRSSRVTCRASKGLLNQNQLKS
jgi:hypothetical protein